MATHGPGDDPTSELTVPAARPRGGGRGCLVALAIAAGLTALVVLVAAALLARASDSADRERRREAADVELTGCVPTGAGFMASTVRITNNSTKRSNYVVDVVFENADGSRQLAARTIFVNDLEPGQATQQEAGTLTPSPARFGCRVSQVQRFSDEG